MMLIGLALALVVQPGGGGAALAPAGSWTIDLSDECALSRRYKTAEGDVILALKPDIMQPGGDVVLVLPGPGGRALEQGTGRITLGPGGASFPIRYLRVPVGGSPFHGVTIEPDERLWAALPEATELTIEAGEPTPIRLSTGDISKAHSALRSCHGERLRSWGVDPAALVASPPASERERWFSAADGPMTARRSGRSVALLTVNRAGEVVGCRTVQSAGDPRLDGRTCVTARQRARFAAAPDGPEVRYAPVSFRWWTKG